MPTSRRAADERSSVSVRARLWRDDVEQLAVGDHVVEGPRHLERDALPGELEAALLADARARRALRRSKKVAFGPKPRSSGWLSASRRSEVLG